MCRQCSVRDARKLKLGRRNKGVSLITAAISQYVLCCPKCCSRVACQAQAPKFRACMHDASEEDEICAIDGNPEYGDPTCRDSETRAAGAQDGNLSPLRASGYLAAQSVLN